MSICAAYVPGSAVAEYEAEGWVPVDTAKFAHHDAYSALMSWPGPEAPPNRKGVEERLTAKARLQAELDECEAHREDDGPAFQAALTALGLVAWNCRHAIESALT